MLDQIATTFSYDKGDTGFLNAFFSGWYHRFPPCSRLPFGFNAQRTLHWFTFKKQPAYWNSIQNLKVIHYSSSPKPWEDQSRQSELETTWYHCFNESQMFLRNSGSESGAVPRKSNNHSHVSITEKFKKFRKVGLDHATAMAMARAEVEDSTQIEVPVEEQVAAIFGFGMS
mmetsp:Transcript_25902/g.51608  ORF Transcript_25902/g.51608 Transcript_25902/m.51608 type:complete len:171 (+) Transcript_25902:211-723(+)